MSWQCQDYSASRWMYNSKGETPCAILSRVLQTCQADAAIITRGDGYSCYTRPSLGPSECCCSSITYALYSACWECQWAGDFTKDVNTTYNSFVSGCQMPYISTFPPSVNPLIRSVAEIPSWAALPPMGNTLWDINAAKANVTGAVIFPTVSTTFHSFPTTPIGEASLQSSSTNAGAIAGGVIGAIVGLLLIGGLVFFFLVWRRKKRQEKLAPSTIHRSLQMSQPTSHSYHPPHVQPAPLTTMQNEKPRSGGSQQPHNASGGDLPSQGAIEGAQWYFKLIPWRRRKIEHAGPGAKVDLAEEPVSPVSAGGKSNTDPTPHGGGMGPGVRPGSLGYQYAGVVPFQMGPGGGGEQQQHGSIGHSQSYHAVGFGQVFDPESPPPPAVVHVTPLTTPIPSRGQGYYGHGIPQVDTPQVQPPAPPPQQQQYPLHNRPLPLPPSSNSSPPNQNPFTDVSIGQLQPISTYPTLAQNRAAAGAPSSPPAASGSKRASAATSKGGKRRNRLQVVGQADSDDDSGSDGGGLPPSQQYLAEMAMSDSKRMDEKAVLAQREREEEARQAAAASELHRRRAHLGGSAVPASSARAGGSHDSHNSFAPVPGMQQQLPTPSYSYPSPPAAGPMDASRSQPHLYPHPDSSMFPVPGSAPVPSSNPLHQQYQQPPRQYVDPRFTPPRITPALIADEARREEERIQEALRMAEQRRKSVKNWVEESRQSMRGAGGMSVAERLEGPNATLMPTLSDVGHGSNSGGHGARIDLLGEQQPGGGGGAGAPSSYKNRTGGGRW